MWKRVHKLEIVVATHRALSTATLVSAGFGSEPPWNSALVTCMIPCIHTYYIIYTTATIHRETMHTHTQMSEMDEELKDTRSKIAEIRKLVGTR